MPSFKFYTALLISMISFARGFQKTTVKCNAFSCHQSSAMLTGPLRLLSSSKKGDYDKRSIGFRRAASDNDGSDWQEYKRPPASSSDNRRPYSNNDDRPPRSFSKPRSSEGGGAGSDRAPSWKKPTTFSSSSDRSSNYDNRDRDSRPRSFTPDYRAKRPGNLGPSPDRESFRSIPRKRDQVSPHLDGSQRPFWQTEEKTEPIYGYYDGDHLYGINPVRLALKNPRRKISELLVQADLDIGQKKDSRAVQEILRVVEEKGIPKREFSKHDLNMLSDNRPHQGFVLRAQPLDFINLDYLQPSPDYKVVLALDEVWDPQNFGALLRSSYFLGCDAVLVCSKNSAPLSPVVSKASAGAMEMMQIYSTDNLMRCLDKSKEQGWQVIGTEISSSAVDFRQVPLNKPTIVVLGNEGHGMRTNIVRRCDHLVKIESNADSELEGGGGDEVDSLNVSVTGGILLHHFISRGGGQI